LLLHPVTMPRVARALIDTKPRRLAFAPALSRELAAPRVRAAAHTAALVGLAIAVFLLSL